MRHGFDSRHPYRGLDMRSMRIQPFFIALGNCIVRFAGSRHELSTNAGTNGRGEGRAPCALGRVGLLCSAAEFAVVARGGVGGIALAVVIISAAVIVGFA